MNLASEAFILGMSALGAGFAAMIAGIGPEHQTIYAAGKAVEAVARQPKQRAISHKCYSWVLRLQKLLVSMDYL